jgi:hypothetical protein
LGNFLHLMNRMCDELRQAAGYIDRILRGARAGELPIQFELVIKYEDRRGARRVVSRVFRTFSLG